MSIKLRAIYVVLLLVTAAAGGSEAVTCPNADICGKVEPATGELCTKCGYPLPIPETENGVAIFNFDFRGFGGETERLEDAREEYSEKITNGFSDGVDDTGKFGANWLEWDTFENLSAAFRTARGAEQQLLLVGDVIGFEKKRVSISAYVYDIETGYKLAEATADCDEAGFDKALPEIVSDLAEQLPYRGRLSDKSSRTATFDFPFNFDAQPGGRVEVYASYRYPGKKSFADGERSPSAGEEYWFDLSPVRPKLVLSDKGRIKIENQRLRIGKAGGIKFEENDICYYYPPREITPSGEVEPLVVSRERWFAHLGGGYGQHGYPETAKSRESTYMADVRLGRGLKPWGLIPLPQEYGFGFAVHVPYEYEYEHGQGSEGRGRIMGSYVASLSAAWDFILSEMTSSLVPPLVAKLGAEVDYFLPYGSGVYEQGESWEKYENELWDGFLVGPRLALGFSWGKRKQYQVTGEVYYGFPLPKSDYGEHFKPLWRFPFGVRYYF